MHVLIPTCITQISTSSHVMVRLSGSVSKVFLGGRAGRRTGRTNFDRLLGNIRRTKKKMDQISSHVLSPVQVVALSTSSFPDSLSHLILQVPVPKSRGVEMLYSSPSRENRILHMPRVPLSLTITLRAPELCR